MEDIKNTLDGIVERIRKFLFAPAGFRSQSRRRQKGKTTDTRGVNIDLLTVNLPQKSLEDDINWNAIQTRLQEPRILPWNTPEGSWDAIENRPQGTRTLRSNIQEMNVDCPYASMDLREKCSNDEGFHGVLDKFGARGPFNVASMPKPVDPPTAFRYFSALPFELRLQIWQLTIQPRVVHFNLLGAKRSNLKIDQKPPVILKVCHESRCERLRMFEINPKATRPFFFNPKVDTLLWLRYPNCPKTIVEDGQRLLNSTTLNKVRNLAIVNHYWNKLLSNEGPKEMYTAIRKAPSLEVLTLVDDYFVRRHGANGLIQLLYGMEMKLVDIPPEEVGVRKVRWKREVQREGKETVWENWDVHLTNWEGLPTRDLPEIRFMRAVLEKPA